MYGVYVHIPWCRRQCPYCAFAISTRRAPPHAAYTEAVLRDWARQAPHYSGAASSLYFGGGTPSLAPPEDIARILTGVGPEPGAEVSMEANPAELAAPLTAYRDAGVNRLSLGVQSFDPWVARRLGRGHGSDDARALVEEAQAAGFRSVSFDLIFAVPGQDLGRFRADLDAVVALAPDHVSLYGLTIEPGTPFSRSKRPPVDDDVWRGMYDLAVETLARAGLERYEVSNFARAGHRSVHNEHYWRARAWAGLGASAHGWRPDGVRVANMPDAEAYLRSADPTIEEERPAPSALAYELLWSTLRHVDGVDRAVLRARTGLDVDVPAALVRQGLVRTDDLSVRLTPAGFPLADALATRIHASLVPTVSASRPSPDAPFDGYSRPSPSGTA